MDQKLTAVERAFQLARSGSVAGLADITTSLNREGYYANQIEGPVPATTGRSHQGCAKSSATSAPT